MKVPQSVVQFAAALVISGSIVTAQADWYQVATASVPQARTLGAFVYDAVRGESVLFGGGERTPVYSDDTWVWNGSTWQLRSPGNRPSPRWSHAMTFEFWTGRVLLFGGSNGPVSYGDTWVWDGTNWTELSPATSPSPRAGAGFAYDTMRARAVLVGGRNLLSLRRDTWEWDGANWILRSHPTQLPLIANQSMSYDEHRGVTVMFGGSTGGASGPIDRTWEWDGADWTSRTPVNTPPARFGGTLEYDSLRRVHVLFGGYNNAGDALGDTWEWNGVEWTRRSPASVVSPRAYHHMAYDSGSERMVLYGGEFDLTTATQDTFEYYTNAAASLQGYGGGCNTSLGRLSLGATSGLPWTGDTVTFELVNLPGGSLPFLVLGLQATQIDLGPLGIPGCTQYLDPLGSLTLPLQGTSAMWNWQVPASPVFAGVTVRLQGGALLAGGNNAFGAATSNGLEAVIGVR